jgi:hypothetical protein
MEDNEIVKEMTDRSTTMGLLDIREEYDSNRQYSEWLSKNQRELDKRWQQVLDLQAANQSKRDFLVDGYCWVCGKESKFLVDFQYSNGHDINWRERLCCQECGLNNRLRLTVQILETLQPGPIGYLTEHLTPLADLMRKRKPGLLTSEFLGPGLIPGSVSKHGVRHEDLTRLSLDKESLDFVVSCDVIEHIPDFRAALSEICRVLKPQGVALISAPFAIGSDLNIIRAILRDNETIHLLEPEYHGDPVGGSGILCFYHFGWEILQDLRNAGFATASLALYWSARYANIGAPQIFFIARK